MVVEKVSSQVHILDFLINFIVFKKVSNPFGKKFKGSIQRGKSFAVYVSDLGVLDELRFQQGGHGHCGIGVSGVSALVGHVHDCGAGVLALTGGGGTGVSRNGFG